MLIVGDNLKQLCKQFKICDEHLVEEFSIQINLGKKCYFPNKESNKEVIYGRSNPECITKLFNECEEITENLLLEPGMQALASSSTVFKMPLGYFGMVQTKGTLARLFVTATCNDGQIEPGFEGLITLEMVNLSPWKVGIPIKENVAQLFIFKCSSSNTNKYSGRYLEAAKNGPTLPIFN